MKIYTLTKTTLAKDRSQKQEKRGIRTKEGSGLTGTKNKTKATLKGRRILLPSGM